MNSCAILRDLTGLLLSQLHVHVYCAGALTD